MLVLCFSPTHNIPPLSATILTSDVEPKEFFLGPHLHTRRKRDVENGTSLYFPTDVFCHSGAGEVQPTVSK